MELIHLPLSPSPESAHFQCITSLLAFDFAYKDIIQNDKHLNIQNLTFFSHMANTVKMKLMLDCFLSHL